MRSKRLARGLLVGSAALFVASLTQNAFCLGRVADPGVVKCDQLGAAVLALGWMEILTLSDVGPFVVVPWFANPCLVMAWVLVLDSRRGPAMAFAGLGSVLGLSFLFGRIVQVSEGGAGAGDPIVAYGAGYWLWLGSLALAFLSAVFSRRVEAAGPIRP
jgi:hypothetical protein